MGLSWLTSHYPWLPALQVGALQSVAGCVVLLVGVLSLCECENQEQSLVSSLQWLQWEQIGVICGTETTLQCSCQNSVHSRGIIFPFAASILLASRVLGWGKSRSCSQPGILFTMAQYPSQPIVPIRRQLRTAALHLKGKVRREKGRQAGSPNTPHWRSVSLPRAFTVAFWWAVTDFLWGRLQSFSLSSHPFPWLRPSKRRQFQSKQQCFCAFFRK